jgi:heme oxygenase (staphylobilin-producing)
MIAIVNRLAVKDGAADRIVERFTESRGHEQGFPGFVSMKVLKSDMEGEVLVVTHWQDKGSFDAWVGIEECCTPSALAAPRITVPAVR